MPLETPPDYCSNDFYVSDSAAEVWEEVEFGFRSGAHILRCTTPTSLEYSFDGVDTKSVHGLLEEGETITYEGHPREFVFIRSTSSSTPTGYKIWAW